MKTLENLFGDYYYFSSEEEPGSLLKMGQDGDTLIPPFDGRFYTLSEAKDADDAHAQACEWEKQTEAKYPTIEMKGEKWPAVCEACGSPLVENDGFLCCPYFLDSGATHTDQHTSYEAPEEVIVAVNDLA